ncbi:sigma-70 family RNA polymerase sigma factor [Corynebacterium jeikeium]|uniref:sigma-70 family RNA polymerase sigma factor n=1 Tax=Corynebacterium jeikeium TaxID=38289 RepID=UPI0001B715E0|nr:sigma-70 family RNA polymerase sigma factor [Corynebacterium jeikeium]EEW15534.1 Sigma-70 region 2 [Corynebacterium jeikeium ATCC 43734]OOD31131.1 RNA polymerase subunit sigma [Corynebacterium jeikeium]WCZ52579.1 ECF RNA polymerase sigma factor SigK [Corynebacterium jeikeium]SCW99602.1 Sigma-K factor [Corynebacterium jeikeium]SQI18800.1 ECF family RNA polymerase sigma factor K [Corynebacterium jeikeium]
MKTVAVVDRETLESLMLLTQQGDAAAFARLYDHIAPTVLGLSLQILHDQAQAEEVTQEVFIEVWQHAADFDPAKGSAKAWILRRARLRAIDRVRSAIATLKRDDREAFLVASIKKESVEDEALRNVQRHAVRTALEIMGEPHKTAILLAYFGDMTHAELAEATGVPLGTAKTRVRDGLRKLEKILKEQRDALAEGGAR